MSDNSYTSISEIIEVRKHPKGGYIVTTEGTHNTLEQRTKGGLFSIPKREWAEKPITREWLRPDSVEWYTWPALNKVAYDTARTLRILWDEYQTRQKYSPPPGPYKPKAKGNPNRCMFCHTDLSKMAA
jgi:hypothetical protein